MPVTVRASFAVTLPEFGEGGLKEDIQWMPPGVHEITPTVDGKPRRITARCTEAGAKRVAAQLAAMIAKAAEGNGDLPYFDFNHDDSGASGHPSEFYWAGDDPKKGGIRAKVAWTSAGEEALKGRVFRRFSPRWDLDPKTGEIVGVVVNAGGLVNRAAFQTIESVAAKDQDQKNPMNETDKQELANLISAALNPIATRLDALEAKAKDNETSTASRIAALESSAAGSLRAQARAAVDQAKRSGQIPAADTKLAEFWENSILRDGESALAALAKLNPNPALARTTDGASGGDHGNDPAIQFATAVKAKAVELKSTVSALRAVSAEHPEWHKAWLAADGKPGI